MLQDCNTILDELVGHLVVLLHQSQIERGSVADFIISVIKASRKQNGDTALDLWILLTNTELGQCGHSSSADKRILQDHSVVDVANVLGGL